MKTNPILLFFALLSQLSCVQTVSQENEGEKKGIYVNQIGF